MDLFFHSWHLRLEVSSHATSQIGFNQGDKIFWANNEILFLKRC